MLRQAFLVFAITAIVNINVPRSVVCLEFEKEGRIHVRAKEMNRHQREQEDTLLYVILSRAICQVFCSRAADMNRTGVN